MEESWSGSFSGSCWVRCPTHWRGDYPTEGSAEGGGTRAETREYICGDGSLKKKSVWFGEKMQILTVNANTVFLSSFNTFVRDYTEELKNSRQEFRGVDWLSIYNIKFKVPRGPWKVLNLGAKKKKIKTVEFLSVATGQWKHMNLLCAKRKIEVLNSWCCYVDPCLRQGLCLDSRWKSLNLIFKSKPQSSCTASTTEHCSFPSY